MQVKSSLSFHFKSFWALWGPFKGPWKGPETFKVKTERRFDLFDLFDLFDFFDFQGPVKHDVKSYLSLDFKSLRPFQGPLKGPESQRAL